MAKREDHQWAVYNYAEIGRNPSLFENKEDAMKYAMETAEDKNDPFIKVDEDNKWIDYRGKVYL